jgi:hypothetical protein
MNNKKEYFGYNEEKILNLRSLIHRKLYNAYKKQIYSYIDFIINNDDISLYFSLPQINENNLNKNTKKKSLILNTIFIESLAYGNTLNSINVKDCNNQTHRSCAPAFMMNLILNLFMIIDKPNNILLDNILVNEDEKKLKIIQEPPSIRSQNERFNKFFLESNNFETLNSESTTYLNFCDVVFKFIDNNFRKFDSNYKFDGLSYTILNKNNEPDLRETMYVYIDAAFNIISFLKDNYKTEKYLATVTNRRTVI